MISQNYFTLPVNMTVTHFIAENVKALLWESMMGPENEGFEFNGDALKLLHSRFEYLSGDNDGGFQVSFQLHELVSFVHFIDAMIALDKVHGSSTVAHRTREFQQECVKEVLRKICPEAVSEIIRSVNSLYLEMDERCALEAKLQDGGARNLNWEYGLRKLESDAFRLRFDLLVDLDPELFPHTQVSPVEIEAK